MRRRLSRKILPIAVGAILASLMPLLAAPAAAECNVARWVDNSVPGHPDAAVSWRVSIDGGTPQPLVGAVRDTAAPVALWSARLPAGIDWGRNAGPHVVELIAVDADGETATSVARLFSWAGCTDPTGDGVTGGPDLAVFYTWHGYRVPDPTPAP